jgi:hypothetical protein
MGERIEIFELIERLDAASRDETLSDGMLYRAAAERLAEYISRDVKYWHSIMQRTDKQADRIAELKARIEAVMNLPTYNGYLVPNDVYNQLGDEGE